MQSMQPKVKRWQPVYAALLKTGVITTEEIMQIAGVGYNDVASAKQQTEGLI